MVFNSGDGLRYHDGMQFSAYDQDNDSHPKTNCAAYKHFKGGWWYSNCYSGPESMLNGHYTHRNNPDQGIIYRTFGKYSLKKFTMKIRRV